MLKKIDRILLRVPAVAAAAKYYADTFGLEPVKIDKRIASFRIGDAELLLHNDPDLPAEGVYYLVDNVRDLHARRKELNLTFISPPAAASRGWRATVRDPFGLVLLLLDRTGDASSAVEDAKVTGTLFDGVPAKIPVRKELLASLYEQTGRTADDLPYTPHFETMVKQYAAKLQAEGETGQVTHAEVWRHLLNLRKAGKLAKLGPARSIPPEISPEDREHLKSIVSGDIGRRDRLPYTSTFDGMVDAFNKTQPRPLSPHLVWRLVATLAK